MTTTDMQTNQGKEIVIISTVSKCGRRLVLGVSKKYENSVQPYYGQPVRVTLEPLL